MARPRRGQRCVVAQLFITPQWLSTEIAKAGSPVTGAVSCPDARIDGALFRRGANPRRTDFGLTWNQALETGGVLASNEVKTSVEVELIRQANQAAA